MMKIKFSEDYEKLPLDWEGTQAVLIGVSPVKLSLMKMAIPKFLDYDTKFRGKSGRYDLNFDDALILTFIHINTGKPFTTIRRNYERKMNYYINSIGKIFELARSIKKAIK